MARQKKYFLCILNIKTHPHSPENYLNLFQDAFRHKDKVKVRGDEFAMIGTCNSIISKEPLSGLSGFIYKYFDLQETSDWLNINRFEEATDEELSKIKIPESLKPHLCRFAYVFFPKQHRIVITTNNETNKTFGPVIAKRLFDKLFNNDILAEKYGEVIVDIEQSAESLDKMFRHYILNNIKIRLNKPNSDIYEQSEEEIHKRFLDDPNATKVEISYSSPRERSLIANRDIRALSKAALSNGEVFVSGKDSSGNPVAESTLDHPRFESVTYNPKKHEFMALIIQRAKQLLGIQ